jgi:DNA-binding transcriptional LysR family regulator
VSHHIRKLEDELGETLLLRGKAKIVPTVACQLVLAVAERTIADIDGLKEHFASAGKGPLTGTLQIAATSLGMAYLYWDLVQAFIARHPGIEVTFHATGTSEESLRRVLDCSADVVCAPFDDEHPNLEMTPLGQAEHVIIVKPGHPLTKEKALTKERLRQTPFVRFYLGSGSRTKSDQIFDGAGGYPPMIAESNDIEFVKRVVSMGVAFALVPAFTVTREVESRSLKMLRVQDRTFFSTFGLMHRKGETMRAVQLLESFCLQMAGADGFRVDIDCTKIELPDKG